MGKNTISMTIFNSYVSLPEGIPSKNHTTVVSRAEEVTKSTASTADDRDTQVACGAKRALSSHVTWAPGTCWTCPSSDLAMENGGFNGKPIGKP